MDRAGLSSGFRKTICGLTGGAKKPAQVCSGWYGWQLPGQTALIAEKMPQTLGRMIIWAGLSPLPVFSYTHTSSLKHHCALSRDWESAARNSNSKNTSAEWNQATKSP